MTNTIRQLGNLEIIIQMGILDWFKGKKEEENLSEINNVTGNMFAKSNEPVDPSRRKFMKTSLKVAAGAAVSGSVLGQAADAYGYRVAKKRGRTTVYVDETRSNMTTFGAGHNKKHHLPRILSSLIEDPIETKIDGIPPGIANAGPIYIDAWQVRDKPEKLIYFIPKLDFKNEPASYLIAGYIYKNPQVLARSKHFGNFSKNHAMTHWAEEIGMYLNKYLRGFKNVRNSQIENPAHKAMIIASGGQSINNMVKNGVDLNKITNPKILIWATTWLIYMYLDEEKNWEPIHNKIGKSLEKKYPNLRVRRNRNDEINVFYDNEGGIII